MGDKCQAHDQCMGKIQDGVDSIRDMLRDGSVKFATLELRVTRLEQAQGGWNWKNNFLRLAFSLFEKAILVIVAMATWAAMNGWRQ